MLIKFLFYSLFKKDGDFMFEGKDFIFDNITGSSQGIYIVTDGGETRAPFGTARNIIEQKVTKNPKPFFHTLEEEPLQFSLTFWNKNGWSKENRLYFAKWIMQEYYSDFSSEDYYDEYEDEYKIIYKVICIDRPEKIMHGNIPNLITLNFRCDSPWSYTTEEENIFDCSTNSGTPVFEIEAEHNNNKKYYPEIEIELKSTTTDITLTNLTTGVVFSFTDLTEGETIYINNEKRQIISDIPDTYRLDNFNKNWMYFEYDENEIELSPAGARAIIKIKTQYPQSM